LNLSARISLFSSVFLSQQISISISHSVVLLQPAEEGACVQWVPAWLRLLWLGGPLLFLLHLPSFPEIIPHDTWGKHISHKK
jgi:hypothetical protein